MAANPLRRPRRKRQTQAGYVARATSGVAAPHFFRSSFTDLPRPSAATNLHTQSAARNHQCVQWTRTCPHHHSTHPPLPPALLPPTPMRGLITTTVQLP